MVINENKIITKQKATDNRDKYPGYSGAELSCIDCEITELTIRETKYRIIMFIKIYKL